METTTDVSRVARSRVAARVMTSVRSPSARAVEEAVVLGGETHGDAQASVEARPRAAVADQHAVVDEALPHRAGVVAAGAEQHEVGAGGIDVEVEVGQRGADAATLLDDRCHPAFHVADEPQRHATGGLLRRVEVVRQHHRLQSGDQPRRCDEVAEAGRRHRPRLGERAHDGEGAVVADAFERRPVRELGVRLVDHDEAGRHVEHGVEHGRRFDQRRSGCSASTGTSPPAGHRARPRPPPRGRS